MPRPSGPVARPARARSRRSAVSTSRGRTRVAVISLGCPKNLVDTEIMLGLMQEAGLGLVPDLGQADVLVVNTCSFIESAREEARTALKEGSDWRRARPGRVLICAGCWPEMDLDGLLREFPGIDGCMGPGDVSHIVSIIEDAARGEPVSLRRESPYSHLYDEQMPRLRTTPPWTAYLRIAEGCSHRCRFCVIPQVRGRYRSRPAAAVLREAEGLAAAGVREINVVAQDTTAYGGDAGEGDLSQLLAALARVEDLRWIRLLYGYPAGVTEPLVEVMTREDRVCKYLDVPLQHAHPRVLRRMGRSGDGDTHLRLIEGLREAMPDIAIRSTFLVGFPGEGDREFETLLDFLERAQLDRVGAFCYSREAGTPAADMPHQVPAAEARRRYDELMALQQRISLARNERWLGRDLDVLVESRGEGGGEWVGRSFRDAPEVDGVVKVSALDDPSLAGKFLRVRIVGADAYDLVGRPPETQGVDESGGL